MKGALSCSCLHEGGKKQRRARAIETMIPDVRIGSGGFGG